MACPASMQPATGRPTPTLTPTGEPTLVLGDVVLDPKASYNHQGWDVGGVQGGKATWDAPYGQATYEFHLPATIGDAGGSLTLHIHVKVNTGTRWAPGMSVLGEFDFFQNGQGVGPPGLTVLGESGETKDGSITVTIKHRTIDPKAKEVLLGIGLLDGPYMYAHYKVQR